jgi:hypothetical protein
LWYSKKWVISIRRYNHIWQQFFFFFEKLKHHSIFFVTYLSHVWKCF